MTDSSQFLPTIPEIVGGNKLWNQQEKDMIQCLFDVDQICDDRKNRVSFKTKTNLFKINPSDSNSNLSRALNFT